MTKLIEDSRKEKSVVNAASVLMRTHTTIKGNHIDSNDITSSRSFERHIASRDNNNSIGDGLYIVEN